MNVGNSLNKRYYAQYQNRTNVKKSTGATSFERSYFSKETATNQKNTGTATYQDVYQAWMSRGVSAVREYMSRNVSANETQKTGAVSIVETEDEGEFLGLTMVPEACKSLFDFFAAYTEKKEVKEEHNIDFSRFAPNAPAEVRKAFQEAAEETGYYEYSGKGKMNHISQIHVRQVENRQNGVANYMDVFGGSAASALQAARQMLYDLENPLMPDNKHSEDVIKYREQEKEFYRAFIEKLEGLTDVDTVMQRKWWIM